MLEKSNLQTFIKKKHFIRQTGFTLIELLATLAILGVITGIAVPAVGNIREKAKQSAYDSSVALIEKASTIADVDGLDYSDGVYGVYTVQDLIDEGYLSDVSDETLLSGYTSRVAVDRSTYVFNGDILDTPSSESTWQEWADSVIAESPEYVVAEDEDFIGDEDGKFIYNGDDEKVIVPEIIKGVTITKGKDMFSKGTPVEAVAINNPNLIDMSYMFHNNPSTKLDVSNLVTENAWRMEGMFKGSKSESLDLSGFDTSKVEDMKYMFQDSKATTVDLSSFDTSKVTSMKRMFYQSQATSLDLSSFDTSNVTHMTSMFAGSRATELDLSNFKTHNVKEMTWMFMNSKLTVLDLSSFDTSQIPSMNMMSQIFSGSKATTAYAKTLADADKFNNSSSKPTKLTFVVK